MFPVDYHIHTNYTPHAVGTIKDCCEGAVKSGLKEIAITDHLTFPGFENVPMNTIKLASMKIDQIPTYFKDIEEARKQFRRKIKLVQKSITLKVQKQK
ncbi:MAG: PHP domain-containing protein [Candidatus Bathyarchaeota archaeon]|nr:MAG: PHP domain-containing protein [Candidatus Bathyarchaeota archaeon]